MNILNTVIPKMFACSLFEPLHDKTNKLGSLATQWAHSEDSNQTGQMPRLIQVFAGHTVILLVLSWGGSNFCDFEITFFEVNKIQSASHFLMYVPYIIQIFYDSVEFPSNQISQIKK